VAADIKGHALQTWLSGTKAMTLKLGNDMITAMLESAQSYFETGLFEQSLEMTHKILSLEPSFDQHIRALAIEAWVKLFNANRSEAEEAVGIMLNQVKVFRKIKNTDLTDRAEVIALVQAARLHNYYHDDPKFAEKYYRKAEHLLQPYFYYETGAISTGRGLIAQHKGLLEEAHHHYRIGVEAFAQARWQWGLGAALNNIACVVLLRFEAMPNQKSVEAKNLLLEAKDILEQSLTLAGITDLSSDIDVETNLVFICRNLGDFDAAREYLKQARRVFVISQPVRQQGLYYAEKPNSSLLVAACTKPLVITNYQPSFSRI
jgi:tetratricopeptide (TPR) repeat protein